MHNMLKLQKHFGYKTVKIDYNNKKKIYQQQIHYSIDTL